MNPNRKERLKHIAEEIEKLQREEENKEYLNDDGDSRLYRRGKHDIDDWGSP